MESAPVVSQSQLAPLGESLTKTVKQLETIEKLLNQVPAAKNLEGQLTDSV
jgi:hypothetical protein